MERRRSKKQITRYICYGVAAFLILAGLLVYFLMPERYATAETVKKDIHATVEADGLIKSNQVQTFYSDWQVGIDSLKIKEGDTVQKGDLLVSFNTRDLQLAVEQSEYQQKINTYSYQGADENNEKWRTQLSNAAGRVAQIKGDIETWNTYKVELEHNMDVDIDARIAELKKSIYRYEQLNANLTVEMECFQHDDDTNKNLKQSYENNQAEIARLQNEVSLLDHYAYSDNKKDSLREIENKLTTLQNDLTQAETDWNTANAALQSNSTITSMQQSAELTTAIAEADSEKLDHAENGFQAEFDGVVTEITCNGGEIVNKGDQLFTISSLEDVCVQAEVSKYDIEAVQVGQTAEITLNNLTYEGTVSKIYGMASAGTSEKPKVIVEVRISAPDSKLYLGLKVHTTLSVGEANQVLVIPNEAIYEDNDGTYCYVIEKGKIAKKIITTGLTDHTDTEVVEGLTEGMPVILTGITDDMIGERGACQ